jgi:mRNA interferase MazF
MTRKKSGFPKRGDVWWVDFDPSLGTESAKTRPAIIVSNDVSNEFLERVQVVPLTSNTAKVYPSETVIRFTGKESKAAADQLATVSKRRLKKKSGRLTSEEMADVAHILKLQLGL